MQGEVSEAALFIVYHGTARATRLREDGEDVAAEGAGVPDGAAADGDSSRVSIGLFGTGDYFGSSTIVDNRLGALRSVTVTADGPLKVLALRRDIFGERLGWVLEMLRRELHHRHWLLQFRDQVRMGELEKGPTLGEGTHGRVRLAIDQTFGSVYAVKQMAKQRVRDSAELTKQVLAMICHPPAPAR